MSDIKKLFAEISLLGFTEGEKASIFSHFINQPSTIISNTLAALFNLKDDGKIVLLRKYLTPVDGPVHAFVDNSNFFITGSRVVTELFNLNDKDTRRLKFYANHGRLIETILKGRRMGKIFIVGSAPPYINEYWDRLRDHGYNVEIVERQPPFREKKVDIKLSCKAMRTILLEDPGIFALVAGDGDYAPVLEEAIVEKLQVETHFWGQGISHSLKEISLYHSLDGHYKSLMYVIGPKKCEHTLKIDGGGITKDWRWNEILMECFNTLDLFGWWYWTNDKSALLYFDNQEQLENAKNLLKGNYPKICAEEVDPSIDRLIYGDNQSWY